MKDNSKAQLAILIAGCVIFLALFVLSCIYSNKNEVLMYFSKPLLFIPYAEMGLTFGLFLGLDAQLNQFVKTLFLLFVKLIIAAAVFECIRAVSTHGLDALAAILALIGDNDDADLQFAGYSILNILMTAPVLLAGMFLGRAAGTPFSKTKEAAQ